MKSQPFRLLRLLHLSAGAYLHRMGQLLSPLQSLTHEGDFLRMFDQEVLT